LASLQSHAFRPLAKMFSARLDSIESISDLRSRMASLAAGQPLPHGTICQPASADGVPVEWIQPGKDSSANVLLYLHGGAWTLGWTNSHRALAGHICRAAGCRALAVDYRLAPEHPFPAALEDCVTAYRWLLKTGHAPEKIVIAGDSAGGNLTLTSLMTLRDEGDPLPAAAVCLSPVTDLEGTGETFATSHDAGLTAGFVRAMIQHYAGEQDLRNPLLSPHYGSLHAFPPLLIQVGEDELLLCDATRLADQARSAGVDVRLVIWPDMWHVWQIFTPYLPEAKQAVNQIGAFIKGRLSPGAEPAV